MMLSASIFQLLKRLYFNKHIPYLLKKKIPLYDSEVPGHLTFDVGGHIRCENIVKRCSKAITLPGGTYFRSMHAGRAQFCSGFTAMAHKQHYAVNPVCTLFCEISLN